MKTKEEIVANWLPRYTKRNLEDFGEYILLTNFNKYVEIFAEKFNVPILGKDANMTSASAEGMTIINFGMGSPNAAIIMDLLSAIKPKACLFLGKCGGIGIILLVALSAKNGILIVEFARDFRAQGNSIRDAAFQAGHIRLRPILMTSLAFVFGVMPLLFATGAGAGSRVALGAAVVFGMALNTLLATVYIPNFYELMQKLQEKFSKKQ